MRKIVLTYGLWAGLIILVLGSLTFYLMGKNQMDISSSEMLGYATMVLSLSMIYFGVRTYRDQSYANPLVMAGITLLEILPVGVVISLLSATLLRRQ